MKIITRTLSHTLDRQFKFFESNAYTEYVLCIDTMCIDRSATYHDSKRMLHIIEVVSDDHVPILEWKWAAVAAAEAQFWGSVNMSVLVSKQNAVD